MKYSEIVNIFKEMAQSHRLINHNSTPGSESFIRILYNPSSLFETKLYLEEFMEKNRSRLKFPCLLFFSTENLYSYIPDQRQDKVIDGIFAIIDAKKKQTDDQQLEEMIDQTEQIAEDMLARLYKMTTDKFCEYQKTPDGMYSHKIGPLAEDCFGTIMYYSFSKVIELFDTDRATDPAIWQ